MLSMQEGIISFEISFQMIILKKRLFTTLASNLFKLMSSSLFNQVIKTYL